MDLNPNNILVKNKTNIKISGFDLYNNYIKD